MVSKATRASQKILLRQRLHPFGDHAQAQALRQDDDGLGNGGVVGVGKYAIHKHFERLIEAFLTNLFNLFQTKFARQDDALHVNLLPISQPASRRI